MSNIFKDYKGFDVNGLSKVKAIKLFDMKNNDSNYYAVYLINKVTPFEITLTNSDGNKIKLNAVEFTDSFGEFAPYPRYEMEILDIK